MSNNTFVTYTMYTRNIIDLSINYHNQTQSVCDKQTCGMLKIFAEAMLLSFLVCDRSRDLFML